MEDMESVDIDLPDEADKVSSPAETGGKSVGDLLVDQRVKRKAKRIIKQLSKEATQTGPNVVQVTRKWKNSRRPRNGYNKGRKEMFKKGNAAGGTGFWGGKLGSEMDEDIVDKNDPNYDSDSFDHGDIQLHPIIPEPSDEDLRKTLEPIILEYYEHGDSEEVVICLEDINCCSKKHMIPQIAIEIALDHKPSHREMTSVLISDLYGRLIKQRDIASAFDVLLKNLPDLILDTPDAPTVLGNFLARSIADDCLPPKIIKVFMEKTECDHAREAVSRADTLLSMKHGLVRLDNVWGVGGGLRPVKYLIRQMRLLLQEYLSSGDTIEATRCLLDLEVPHFHHELVYEAVVMTLEAINTNVEEAMVKLLKSLSDAIIITPDMMELGFTRVFEDMPDIIVDVPLASTVLERFIEQCEKNNVVSSNLVAKMPIRARKRFVSEGDGGRLK